MTAGQTVIRTSIASVVAGEYDVLAGKVMLEVKVGAGHLAVIDLDTRQARELQSVLAELLDAPLGVKPPGPWSWNVERAGGTLAASSQFIDAIDITPPLSETQTVLNDLLGSPRQADGGTL